MVRRFLIIFGFLALIIYFVGFRADSNVLLIYTHDQGVHKIEVEIARTDEEKRKGLMGRSELPDGMGMLFLYEKDSNPVMWMKDMLIPIDIVFIGDDLKINYIEMSAEPCIGKIDRQCNRYGSAIPSTYVLELPAGFSERHGIDWGDQVTLPSGL